MNNANIIAQLMPGYKAAKTFAKPIWDRRTANFRRYVGPLLTDRPKKKEDFHVPYTSTLLNIVWPLLCSRIPIANTSARNADRDRNAARLMHELIQTTFDVNLFELTYLMSVKSSMLFQDSWVKVGWDYQDADRDHATIKGMNTFDVYPHTLKTKLDDAWPIYVRAEMTKPDMIDAGWDKAAIDSLGESKLETESYRKSQLMAMGYGSPDDKSSDNKADLYEVVEVWGKMDLSFGDDPKAERQQGFVVIANGNTILNPKPLPGKKPFESPYSWRDQAGKLRGDRLFFSHLPYDVVPNMLLGQSFIDPISAQQDELDYLEYEKATNTRRRNNPPLKVRKGANIDLSTLKFVNSLPWIVDQPDDITQELIADLAPAIEAQQQAIKSVMQARTGANDLLLVADTNQIKGGDTATGAAIANENTKVRFKPQTTLIDIFTERIGSLLIDLYQNPRFFDRGKAIAIADEEGNYYEEMVKPEMISGDLVFKVTAGSSLAESNEQKLTKAVNLKQLYAEDMSINQDEFDKIIFDAAGYDINKIKQSKEQMAQILAQKLQEMIAVTRQPGFQDTPEAQKQSILARIDQMKQMLQQVTGQEAAPQTSAPATEQPVAV